MKIWSMGGEVAGYAEKPVRTLLWARRLNSATAESLLRQPNLVRELRTGRMINHETVPEMVETPYRTGVSGGAVFAKV